MRTHDVLGERFVPEAGYNALQAENAELLVSLGETERAHAKAIELERNTAAMLEAERARELDPSDPADLRRIARAMRRTVPKVVGLPDAAQLGVMADLYSRGANRLEGEQSEAAQAAERKALIDTAKVAYHSVWASAKFREDFEDVERRAFEAAIEAVDVLRDTEAYQ